MKTVYKYQITPDDNINLLLPKGAKVLSVQMQGEVPCLRAVVDTEAPLENRKFRMAGTGHPLPDNILETAKYIGTFQMYKGALIFHMFEFCV